MTGYLLEILLALIMSSTAYSQVSVDTDEVVLERLFPKTNTFEFEGGAGFLLNPSFVDTAVARVGMRYHWSEIWGLGLTVGKAVTKDRNERACIESFYNDPLYEVESVCDANEQGYGTYGSKSANIGAAYVPIRELNGIATAFVDYTLAYGKQILFQGGVSHFDLRVRLGASIIQSTFYAGRETVRGTSRPSRGDPLGEGGAPKAGVAKGETDSDGLLYGAEGRPVPTQENSPALYFALAEELHFFRRFFLSGELGGYVMVSSEGVDPFFIANVGLGVRL